jgi:acyl transferase domain-containing protein/3-hydroxymyristoyl/3-hydroxydecanoyl-(acyl carrier protein) dehydratase
MTFPPIAVIGQGCVLPGAQSPSALWKLVREQRCVIEAGTADTFGLGPNTDKHLLEHEIASDRGGFVRGFAEIFDATGFRLPAEQLLGLDAVFTWPLHAAREALRSAGHDPEHDRSVRGAVVIGNLSYPTRSLFDFARETWAGAPKAVDPRNRFMSGLPAQLVARAVGFEAGGFALDAACASSLYAIKLACDRLHDRVIDLALAGGVNGADPLFLQLGFTALSALSRSGRSRPFDRNADGLVPAQGAAMVLLKRLEDAVTAGDRILGVIRGIGLSNDGRSRGMLVPSKDGQVRAMREAYAMSGLAPADISLVECHATGTAVGDAIEVRSMLEVFRPRTGDLPIGSLKSNLGHLVTASGAASLLKVLAAMEAGERPATLGADEPLDELHDGPLRLIRATEPWPCDGPRRAAISNFGFGGNNAHLLFEQWSGDRRASAASYAGLLAGDSSRHRVAPEIAVVAQTVIAASAVAEGSFEETWLDGRSALAHGEGVTPDFELDVAGLRLPPSDVKSTFSQQILLVRAAQRLADVLEKLPRERTAILIGMQCDAEGARIGLRWRTDAGHRTESVTAAEVLGHMPNIVANRLNQILDLAAPSFTVSAEEASGTVALEVAIRSLESREIDAAIVGAVDLSCEPVQQAAAKAVLPAHLHRSGDAAILLVCKRLDDARAAGDPVLAVIDRAGEAIPGLALGNGPAQHGLAARFGHAHAASGLLHVAAAVAACDRRTIPARLPDPPMPWLPTGRERAARVEVDALGGLKTTTVVRTGSVTPARTGGALARLGVFTGASMTELARALSRGETTTDSRVFPYRVAIVANDDTQLAERATRASERLATMGATTLDDGVYFGANALEGEVAFVFTGPAGAYPHMGRDLVLALPELVDALDARAGSVNEAAGWVYEKGPAYRAQPLEKLWGSSFLIQLHAELTRGLLAIQPGASIGYCSGETNALFALGAWSDLDDFRTRVNESGFYSQKFAGEFRCVREAWQLGDGVDVAWTSLRVRAKLADIEAALAWEPRVRLTIRNSPTDAIIAGDAEACWRIADTLGRHRVRPIEYDFVMHCPEARTYAAEWRAIHHRPTRAVPGVRFYTHATRSSYALSDDAVADALTGQAMNTVDFPALVARAYADGVRVFIEHGPHAGCTRWTDDVLGERPHLAVALDRYGQSSLLQVCESVARLVAAGVPMDHGALSRRLIVAADKRATSRAQAFPRHIVSVKTHPEPVRLDGASPAENPDEIYVMKPAPPLPPVDFRPPTDDGIAPARSGSSEVLVSLSAQHERLAELHGAFVRQQAQVQSQFVQMMLGLGGRGGWAKSPARLSVNAVVPQPRAEATPPAATTADASRRGPRFGRAELETLAGGRISSVFGPLFEKQDAHARQVRMPEPPLLLADRVLGIDAKPGELGVGTIWTETDVREDSWYLHEGRMPAGIVVESGQADLLLISWMGIDFHNKGERIYRLLGCELTLHGPLPVPGETLAYEIHVDGHAQQGDVRLFFFHYECHVSGKLRVSVRGGQAGFFTDEELRGSAGVLWNAAETRPTEGVHIPLPPVRCSKKRLSRSELRAFVEGRVGECFGAGFEPADVHTRTPVIQGGRMQLIDEVEELDLDGGPWRRGYLRARLDLTPDHWFFPGHFKNDPCMPGTLMLEGCLQAMAVYLTAMGHTLDRDGFRFEPATDVPYSLRCRGQATPASKQVVYEVFVDEFVDGPTPTLYADLLGTVDGLKAFHCRRMALRLVPGWPLEPGRVDHPVETKRASARVDGFSFDERAMLACAWGRPSQAFGPMYAPFDGGRRAPRLPGPPYLFISRIAEVTGVIGGMQAGSSVVAEYDVPRDAWYFAENGARSMPLAALMEVALQPCGWLASYVGCALTTEQELVFRNLDGVGKVYGEVREDAKLLVTRARLKTLSRAGGLIIVGFDVSVHLGDRAIYDLETSFGFFTRDAMGDQPGLRAQASELVDPEGSRVSLALSPDTHGLPLPRERLKMIDKVIGFWPEGGAARLGRLRAEKDVDPGAWFFKAHFFSDPVQPGSLGLEALIQCVQLVAREHAARECIVHPRFESVAHGVAMSWKYRGQVLPQNKRVSLDVELTQVLREEGSILLVADGSLWVDGKKIYSAKGLAVRVLGG